MQSTLGSRSRSAPLQQAEQDFDQWSGRVFRALGKAADHLVSVTAFDDIACE